MSPTKADLARMLREEQQNVTSLLKIIYDIREAAGDPLGRWTLDEIAPNIAKLKAAADKTLNNERKEP